MTVNDAMKLVWIVLLGVPTLAIAIASAYAWYTCSALREPMSSKEYHTNHCNRKGY